MCFRKHFSLLRARQFKRYLRCLEVLPSAAEYNFMGHHFGLLIPSKFYFDIARGICAFSSHELLVMVYKKPTLFLILPSKYLLPCVSSFLMWYSVSKFLFTVASASLNSVMVISDCAVLPASNLSGKKNGKSPTKRTSTFNLY